MTKLEFLRELEFSLLDSLPAGDATEILADYKDIFENGIADGKNEQQIAAELGSPAKIARTIINDLKGEQPEPHITYVIEKQNPDPPENLANMSTRLGAYFIDSILFSGIIILLAMVAFYSFSISTTSAVQVNYAEVAQNSYGTHDLSKFSMADAILSTLSIFFVFLLMGSSMLLSTLFVWLTNGYTPGKWLLKIRIVKNDGSKISLGTAFVRETVMKSIANGLTSSLLNIGSFIWGCCTPLHKTVHDIAVDTTVILAPRVKGE